MKISLKMSAGVKILRPGVPNLRWKGRKRCKSVSKFPLWGTKCNSAVKNVLVCTYMNAKPCVATYSGYFTSVASEMLRALQIRAVSWKCKSVKKVLKCRRPAKYTALRRFGICTRVPDRCNASKFTGRVRRGGKKVQKVRTKKATMRHKMQKGTRKVTRSAHGRGGCWWKSGLAHPEIAGVLENGGGTRGQKVKRAQKWCKKATLRHKMQFGSKKTAGVAVHVMQNSLKMREEVRWRCKFVLVGPKRDVWCKSWNVVWLLLMILHAN